MRVLLLLGFACAMWGQQVASVNLRQAVVECGDGVSAAQRLRAQWQPKEKELADRATAIERERAALSRESLVRHGMWPFRHAMRAKERARRAHAIEVKARAVVRERDDARAAVEKEEKRVIQEIGRRMMPLLRSYAAENGYSVVVDSSAPEGGVLVASNDITREIVALYDRTFARDR